MQADPGYGNEYEATADVADNADAKREIMMLIRDCCGTAARWHFGCGEVALGIRRLTSQMTSVIVL